MKFDNDRYWKHDNCVDVFISIIGISFDDDGKSAIVNASWCVQGTASWWHTGTMGRIVIKPDHYNKWNPYEPKGNRL